MPFSNRVAPRLNKMLQTAYFMKSSKKGINAHRLHRRLEVTYKTAWFLAHRIREAIRSGDLAPFGREGGLVEVDETLIGRKLGIVNSLGGTRHRRSRTCRWFTARAGDHR